VLKALTFVDAPALFRRTEIAVGGILPRVDDVAVDGRVLLFSVAVSAVTALLFGMAPALRMSRMDSSRMGASTAAA
jgi:hypothetical protein